jgi:FkbM family methyltransferase
MNIKYGNKNIELGRLQEENCQVLVIGAMDGVSHDNIHEYIIQNHNWKTIFVEPVKKYFDELKQNFENKTNAYFENSAVTDKNESTCIYRVDYDAIKNKEVPEWSNGISSVNKNSIISLGIPENFILEEQISCLTVDRLINKYSLSKIDILQIDAEGYDYFLFNEFWEKEIRPKFIYLEIVHMSDFELENIVNKLESENYLCFIDESNTDNMFAYKNEIKPLCNYTKSPAIAFFIESKWAFGSIHKTLTKELRKRDINADLIDWNISFSAEDWFHFNNIYDSFVTIIGDATNILLGCNIPSEKIIGMAHGYYDLNYGYYINDGSKFKKIGVVSPELKEYWNELGIKKPVTVLQNGIDFDYFYSPVTNQLSSVGYCGAFSSKETNPDNEDWKRGYLAKNICEQTNTKFIKCNPLYHLAMPNFYKGVDSIIVSSTDIESCGLPIMECSAAGRLPISTHVGITRRFNNPPGVVLPIEEKEFTISAIEKINELKANPQKFRRTCKEAQEFAYTYYDWSYVIDDWIKFLVE